MSLDVFDCLFQNLLINLKAYSYFLFNSAQVLISVFMLLINLAEKMNSWRIFKHIVKNCRFFCIFVWWRVMDTNMCLVSTVFFGKEEGMHEI